LTEPEKEKSPKITELAVVFGVMVSIVVAVTSLLANIANLPLWWFWFSFVLLMVLAILLPTVIFAERIKGRIRQVRLSRKRNSVSRKHALGFKEQVANFRRYGYDFKSIVDNLRSHYVENIKSQLITHILQQESQNGNEINNSLFLMEKEIEESDKTYPSIYLLAKRFEFILTSFQKSLKVIEVFVHEMASNAGKPVSKGIEKDYESFRERYNDFLNDFSKFCHKMNQEAECRDFPEYSFSHLEKW
jgi:hypothetical protein